MPHTTNVPLVLPAENPCVDQCGGICCAQEAYPPFTEEEAKDAASLPLGIRVAMWTMEKNHIHRRRAKLPCYFWVEKTGQCAIHAVRPQACREFKVNGGACQQFRRGERFKKPGRLTVALTHDQIEPVEGSAEKGR